MKDKRLLAGGAVLLGVAGFWFFIKPEFLDATEPPPRVTDAELAMTPLPTVQLEEMVLNLLGSSGNETFVKVEIALEFSDPDYSYFGLSASEVEARNEEFEAKLGPEMHRVRDTIHSVINAKTASSLSGPGGRETLKEELRDAINEQLRHQSVENVYFVTFLTQTVAP